MLLAVSAFLACGPTVTDAQEGFSPVVLGYGKTKLLAEVDAYDNAKPWWPFKNDTTHFVQLSPTFWQCQLRFDPIQ